MDYITKLDTLENMGTRLIKSKNYDRALEQFYNGILLTKKLEASAPSEGLAKIWHSRYENFKKLVLEAQQKKKDNPNSETKSSQKTPPPITQNRQQQPHLKTQKSQARKSKQDAPRHEGKEAKGDLEDIINEEERDFIITSASDKTFSDIVGLEKAKQQLNNLQIYFTHPEYFKELDVQPVRGILLFGPPGCGKTYLVECACGEFGVNLVSGNAATLKGKYVGESEHKTKTMFEAARKAEPCILFVDEIDKILPSQRDESSSTKGLLQIFLVEMIKAHPEYVMIMATNYPQDVEKAIIMNKKRINNIIYVGPPNFKARKKIFKKGLRNIKLEAGLKLEEIVTKLAKVTGPTKTGNRYSASNCMEFCENLKRGLIQEWFDEDNPDKPLKGKIIEDKIRELKPDISKAQISKYERFAEEWAQK